MKEEINKLRDICFNASLDAGWHTDLGTGELLKRNKGEMMMLMVSEIAEAMEGERKNLMDDHLPNRPMVEVEMADAVIRIMDYCGRWNLDIGGAIIEKLAYNANRLDHKIENRKKDNGKKF
jgi:NTP pyrophosphatase (non-canonical NTP hydrolase)